MNFDEEIEQILLYCEVEMTEKSSDSDEEYEYDMVISFLLFEVYRLFLLTPSFSQGLWERFTKVLDFFEERDQYPHPDSLSLEDRESILGKLSYAADSLSDSDED